MSELAGLQEGVLTSAAEEFIPQITVINSRINCAL
uniref:Uncharacterized protein n=1 Tax=Anguilla anguilla TaxID=7936 RepID=A0A0E9VZZ1_ANGAN